MNKDNGSATIQVISILFLILAICIGTFLILATNTQQIAKKRTSLLDHEFLEYLGKVINALSNDITPEADSIFDDVQSISNGYTGTNIKDISSMLNPNWFQSKMLDHVIISQMLDTDADKEEFDKYRISNGISMEIEDWYSSFFSQKVISDFMSAYSYINLNTIDENILERFILDCTEDSSLASAAKNTVMNARLDSRLLKMSDLRWESWYTDHGLASVIGLKAQYNINYLNQDVLRAIMTSLNTKSHNIESTVNILLEEREKKELTDTDLINLTGFEKSNAFFSFVSDTTWFWMVQMILEKYTFEAILARKLPKDDFDNPVSSGNMSNDKREYQIVAWRRMEND
ncbi:MAG: hypothetical protein JXL85_05320 [Bacilli bacterium]|nr:hypothetical protein [Bacilli bacterium]